jgi:predicted DNA-binding protein
MTQHKAQQDSATRLLNFRIAPDMAERLRVVAEAHHRTVSQELRHLIDTHLAEHEGLKEAA